MTQEIRIPAGEHREIVLLNQPATSLHITQEAGSSLSVSILSLRQPMNLPLNSEPVNYIVAVDHEGHDCRTAIYGLAYLCGEENVTIETRMNHAVGQGQSKQLVKFVLDDRARGHFVGQLRIAPDAQQTEAHQTNRNLLLSTQADMRTQPQLEIYADDVQATHGASTGQLDESALFYMQQRGIGADQARRLLVGAFMKEVLQGLEDSHLREELVEAIDGVVE